ncbi:hypothetical protein L596_011623 [Steinernema carpocapsae]|uniref:UDP-galactose transporter n=1 Tax=Steinernema carpocapsae TaxID=34508 RepID=A0A4U5NUH5_STECR|nr:hypothetical protein L596_011623 [Steinernema carpocapsae]
MSPKEKDETEVAEPRENGNGEGKPEEVEEKEKEEMQEEEDVEEMVASGEEVRSRRSRSKDFIIKYASLIILVLQNASYVLLLRYVRTRKQPLFLSTVAVFQTEVVKLITCLIIFTIEQRSITRSFRALYHHLIVNWLDTLKVGVPAFVYVVQNVLLYYAVSNLDAATYMVTYQLKILTTAIFTVTILRRKLSFFQWIALVLLFSGVAIVQLNKDETPAAPVNHTAAALQTTLATVTEASERKQHPLFGLIAVIVACFLSGFAGIYFEKILKGSDVSLWLRNIQLALLSLPCGLGAIMVKDGGKVLEYGMMQGFDIVVWGTVVLGAVGGLVVAVVMKYADNILKAFATSIAIIVSCIASAFLFSFSPTLMFLAGTGLVIIAVFVYSLFPYRPAYQPAPTELKVQDREKAEAI